MLRSLVCALAALALVPSTPVLAQETYAGTWSVLILARKSRECDGTFRYMVRVAPNGTITYAGPSDFTASGRVAANGSVSVRIARGGESAQGTGKLTGRAGRGTWSAPAGNCSGTWRAERRS
jgi:hypothetical protein